jgi:glycosyltransferase involved in cell wall biosynthesis
VKSQLIVDANGIAVAEHFGLPTRHRLELPPLVSGPGGDGISLTPETPTEMPHVTIGIPTFNRCDMLEFALRSACDQDYPDLKIIVSDNASHDGTRKTVERFPGVTYVRQPKNIGSSANMQWLLDQADSELFLWLADDDRLSSSDHIGNLVRAMAPKINMVFPDVTIEYPASKTERLLTTHFKNCVTDKDYRLAWCRFGGGHPYYGLYRTSYLRALVPELKPNWAYFNEGLFLHRVFLNGGARFCADALLIYDGGNSSTKIPSRELLDSFLRYSFQTHLLYIKSALPTSERVNLLTEIGRSHYPYIKQLVRGTF